MSIDITTLDSGNEDLSLGEAPTFYVELAKTKICGCVKSNIAGGNYGGNRHPPKAIALGQLVNVPGLKG